MSLNFIIFSQFYLCSFVQFYLVGRSVTTMVTILNSSNTRRVPYVALLSPHPLHLCHLPNLLSLTTANLLSIPKVLQFQKCYVNRIVYYVTSWDQLFSFSHKSLETQPSVAAITIVCSFLLLISVPWYISQSLTIHPLKDADSQFGLLQLKSAVNICIQVLHDHIQFHFSGINTLGMQLLDHMTGACLVL